MKKQNLILSAALAAIFSTSAVFAEAEVTGKIVHESAKFTTSGSSIGGPKPTTTHDKDVFKTETSARIYIDGEVDEVSEGSTYHVELNLMRDSKGVGDYDGNESYTQRDALREAYVDTTVDDWSIRAGKQQVVWGTADGMKLLDMINPTDYSEMAQNQMEDSRIPVWMINAETTNEDGSEFQVIVSQPRENIFAGLNRNTKTGVRRNGAKDLTTDGTDIDHAFMMMGPDTITGQKNGFLNIAPDLGSIAAGFSGQFGAGVAANTAGTAGLVGNKGMTVKMFNTYTNGQLVTMLGAGKFPGSATSIAGGVGKGADGSGIMDMFTVDYNTNLNNATSASDWGSDKDSAFEYMGDATFSTFDAFYMAGSEYKYNMPENSDIDLAARYKATTSTGVNYSANASYNYDKNPIISMSWRGENDALLHTIKTPMWFIGDPNDPLAGMPTGTTGTPASPTMGDGSAKVADTDYQTTTITLNTKADGSGDAYGGAATAGADGVVGSDDDVANRFGTLQFLQEVKRVTQIGGSFDTAVETEALGPVVIRGEALYTKNGYSPVIDKDKLAIGDLVGALEMVKGDKLKFVVGADITALTNMMISAQFIQESNLDFVDGANRYTADYATMSMSNGFNKAIKNKNFYSLFFSKPFGASGEHRWNNITMLEEGVGGNGKWNRLDAEFSIDDDTQATVEYNKYWGNANTQFGQLEKSSNIQVGVKYSF